MADTPTLTRLPFQGVPVVSGSRTDAVSAFLTSATSGPSTSFRLINAATLAAAAGDPAYQALLAGPGLNLPDGKPLAAVLNRTSSKALEVEQVRGQWFFETCLDRGREVGLRHFFLGASDETLSLLQSRLKSRFPGLEIAGTLSPPFRPRSETELARDDKVVMDSGADVVWVALGTPKQDAEALRIWRETHVTTAAVGAAFDFSAGTKKAAPALVQRLHLEWAHRLLAEPRRLWRRYLVGNTRFLIMVARHVASRPKI